MSDFSIVYLNNQNEVEVSWVKCVATVAHQLILVVYRNPMVDLTYIVKHVVINGM